VYLLIRTLYFIFSLISFEKLQSTGIFLGSVMYYLLGSRRKIAIKNVTAMGFENPEKIVKESFKWTFASYLESFYNQRIDDKFLSEKVTIENNSGITLPMNQGCFVASAHLGSWEISGTSSARILGIDLVAIGRRLKNKKLDEFIVQQRTSQNVSYLHHRNITGDINNALENKCVVAALLDHSATLKDSMFVPFFGIKTTFIKGIPMIAARKDIPVVPVFMLREGRNFRMLFEPAIYPDKSLKPKDRIYDIALRINQAYEKIIKENPEQWYLIHKRFKKIELEDGSIKEDFYD
jgi:KDO2-lipid IV(A) lauroyltransferase